MNSRKFDKDYFENGIKTRVSLYENFRWMPWISLPFANLIKELYPNKSVLDYGCAKGFIVYALRLLNVEAYGYDPSKYAIDNCKEEVRKFAPRPANAGLGTIFEYKNRRFKKWVR